MAAITPDKVIRESIGSMTLIIGRFTTSFNNGDTWATGLSNNIVSVTGSRTNTPTQTKEGIDVINSTGTLTFNTAENTVQADIWILARA